MKLILFIYFTVLCCYIVRADIRDDIGIFLINSLKSITGTNVKSDSNFDIKKNGDILCAYVDEQISGIEKKKIIITDTIKSDENIPQSIIDKMVEIEKNDKLRPFRIELKELNKIKNDIVNSNAIEEIKNYILNCSNIDEKIDKINKIFNTEYEKNIVEINKFEKERLDKIRKKQDELENNCVSCGEVTSFGNGRICCRGNVLKLSDGNYAYGVKTTGLDRITKCFCGTGRDCVNAQDCKQDNQICSDGFCVVGDRKSAITYVNEGLAS
jgi:hypothetical protein